MTAGPVMAATFTFGKGWGSTYCRSRGRRHQFRKCQKLRTFIGVIFMGVIGNGMTLLNIDIHTQYIVKAVIVFLAVLLSSYRAQLKS
jgi:hypothetical protein